MQLDFTIKHFFKRLASWIETELPKVQYDSRIWDPFLRYSQLNDKQARLAVVCNNTPPVVDVAFMNVYGQYYRKGREKNRNKIHLNRSICRRFNNSKDSDNRPFEMELILKATILHEMVHWGDEITDGIRQPDRDVVDPALGTILKNRDVGFQFEVEAFHGIYTEEYLR